MSRPIAYYNGWFFEWSTVVDAPITNAMRYDKFVRYYKGQYGEMGLEELPSRIERAIERGTSSWHWNSLKELVEVNRAGPNETELSFVELLKDIGIPSEEIEKENIL